MPKMQGAMIPVGEYSAHLTNMDVRNVDNAGAFIDLCFALRASVAALRC
ncbi:hypothetical protein Kkor_1555 [Kangiella koreensis DSM 16069]|uniref:Uncharacterized protein n=1 Tax=Kangiella koreensis (strain DSM 16069 / JCM 12317 / KCTC 12182 / SW-125) TaxID=523791 RepID=C7RCH5_KANKD|nr:hypothetical protein Kkor_1555 [Kangiella koreensis DSM 16069]